MNRIFFQGLSLGLSHSPRALYNGGIRTAGRLVTIFVLILASAAVALCFRLILKRE
jgi:hypothetical protein